MRIDRVERKPINCFHILCFSVLTCLFLSHEVSAHTVSADQLTINITTKIDPPDPQNGMKSNHQITLNFRAKTVSQQFQTGTTTISGETFPSIRNKFTSRAIKWDVSDGHRVVKLKVSGHTASGTGVLPGIDYRFTIYISDDGATAIDGCHDGYPSYSIIADDPSSSISRIIYDYKHKPMRLTKLIGKCDTKMSVRHTTNHRFAF